MRVSTGMLYDVGRQTMQRQTTDFLHTQQQLATGRRVLKPSDDPVASARALELGQSQSINTQRVENQGYAKDSLQMVEGTLSSVSDLLTYVRTRAVEAGNATLGPSERNAIASDLRAQYEQLRGLANTRDGEGNYLFSGYDLDTEPFQGDFASGATTYAGDAGERRIQVSASRQIEVSAPGDRIFGSAFDDLRTFIDRLGQPDFDTTDVGNAITAMDAALEQVLTERASVGSRLGEIEALGNLASDYDVQYAETLSRLQDLDYSEAVSRFSMQQTLLQAAQQTYVKVTGLSLFDFLR